MNGIYPNPNYTVLDVIAKNSELLLKGKNHGIDKKIETDQFGYRITKTLGEIKRDKQENSTTLNEPVLETPQEELE